MSGMETCKHNLHGRIIWPKGSTPLTAVALKAKLSQIWKGLACWGITSIGKGFFEFSFSTLEDVRRVRSTASWNLNPGYLKLFPWTRDFNPRLQNNSFVQVWVRIFGLAQEYWRKNILFSIVSGVGSPICTDASTAKPMFERTFGHYARVLVDIDLSIPLRHKLLVERKGFAFYVELAYENVSAYCSHCKAVGHHMDFCKRLYPEEEARQENTVKKQQNKFPKKVYVQTKDGRVEQGKENPAINVEKEVMNVEEETRSENRDKGKEINQELEKTPVKILSPTEMLKAQDLQLELELTHHVTKN